MIVDRLQSFEKVNKQHTLVDQGRFDVYFDSQDITLLSDPEIAYITDRFMGCTDDGFIQGWAPEDKLHIRLKSPRALEEDEKVAEVQLDVGGDLYFTIWNSTALRSYTPIEFQAKSPFVTLDLSGKFAQAGINAFCLHQLVDLSRALSDRDSHRKI